MKEYKFKEGDKVRFKDHPERTFIVRGYGLENKMYLISSEGYNGHDASENNFEWGGPIKGNINWWAYERELTLIEEKALLKEARSRYPKGTVYIPAHLPSRDIKCTVGDPNNFIIVKDDIIESHVNREKNGHYYSAYIYIDGKWAEIVSTPIEEEPEYLTELGATWYSLVGYTLVTEFGEKFEIIEHFQSGRCNCKDSNRTFDVHNIDAPYNMKYKKVKVLTKKPGVKTNSIDSIDEKEETTETFQIGKWYKFKSTPDLYIRPTVKDASEGSIIWSVGTYEEYCRGGSLNIQSCELLDDLSEIQKFLPDGHPDKLAVKEQDNVKRFFPKIPLEFEEKIIDKARNSTEDELNYYLSNGHTTPFEIYTEITGANSRLKARHIREVLGITTEKSLVGRWLKALCDEPNGTDYKKGEHIKILTDNGRDIVSCERFDFDYDWKKSEVELMPEGFDPRTEEKPTELKVGQWVKIIDRPEGGRPIHWDSDGGMDKYFGQWVQVVDVDLEDYEDFSFMIEDDWYLMRSDYTEVRDTYPKSVESWIGVQENAYRKRKACVDMAKSILGHPYPMTPEEFFKVCESKEDILSSHLVLLDVKPVRVSKQFK